MKTLDAKRVLEAALICSSQPMALREMSALFADEVGNDTLRTLLDELADECKGRGDRAGRGGQRLALPEPRPRWRPTWRASTPSGRRSIRAPSSRRWRSSPTASR